jgi:hypothetical protein
MASLDKLLDFSAPFDVALMDQVVKQIYVTTDPQQVCIHRLLCCHRSSLSAIVCCVEATKAPFLTT